MEEMQVSLTLVLVFLIIVQTAVQRPYGDNITGKLLQRVELSTLCLLYLTLWAASVFAVYPRCESKDGIVLWCEMISVIVGLADVLMVILVVLLFIWLKGAASKGSSGSSCTQRCWYKFRITQEWDMQHGGQAQTLRGSVEVETVATVGQEGGDDEGAGLAYFASRMDFQSRQGEDVAENEIELTSVENPLRSDRGSAGAAVPPSSGRFKKAAHRVKNANLVIRAMEKSKPGVPAQNPLYHASPTAVADSPTAVADSPTAAADSPVVKILFDETSGRRYSYSRETRATSWLDDEKVDGSGGAIQILQAGGGRRYSFDPATQVTKWIDPEPTL